MEYHLTAFAAVIIFNFVAELYGSRRTSRVTFWVTAASPMILWIAVNIWFFLKDGLKAYSDPYFFVLLIMLMGFTVVTTGTAFLTKEFARWIRGSTAT